MTLTEKQLKRQEPNNDMNVLPQKRIKPWTERLAKYL